MTVPRELWFWTFLDRIHCPNSIYYWLLDRLTDNNGWRPLSMRHPEQFPKQKRGKP